MVHVLGGGGGPTPWVQVFGGGGGLVPLVQVFGGGGGGPTPMVQVFDGGYSCEFFAPACGGDGPAPFTSLSPPWITLWNKINGSIGNDPSVRVEPLDQSNNPYVVRITVDGRAKAISIASLLKPSHQLGGVSVIVEIRDRDGETAAPVIPGSVDDLVRQVESGFMDNRWYVEVVKKEFLGRPRVYPVFAKGVIQFKNDDLSDLYGNYNAVAATVFSRVLTHSPGGFDLIPSTSER
jgi:hypothetical protein